MRRGTIRLSNSLAQLLATLSFSAQQADLARKIGSIGAVTPLGESISLELSEEELETLLDLVSPPTAVTLKAHRELSQALLRLRT